MIVLLKMLAQNTSAVSLQCSERKRRKGRIAEMDILVVGTGSIGRRHIGNLISIGQRDITAVDKDPKSLDEVKKYYNDIRTINTKEVVSFKDYDAVFICTHPDSHLALLKKAIDGGCHCFMEKPFALTAEGIEPLLKTAQGKN